MNIERGKIISMHTAICIWLTLLYIICITLVIFSLTTYQLQHRIYSTLQMPTDTGFLLKYHLCEPDPFLEEPSEKPLEKPSKVGGLQKFLCIPLQPSSKGTFFSPGSLLQYFNIINKKEEALNMVLEQSAHLTGVHSDIKTYEKVSSTIGLSGLWTLPENILIVFLIFSMGALGSLIFLKMEFLKQGDNVVEKFSNYFFRPLLGMVMALAVFVMFRSGQYSMGIESEEHLSPFFISFMSIISGMMSEKVYGSLKLQGEKILPNENNENNEITK